jgi:hypothetical protein
MAFLRETPHATVASIASTKSFFTHTSDVVVVVVVVFSEELLRTPEQAAYDPETPSPSRQLSVGGWTFVSTTVESTLRACDPR